MTNYHTIRLHGPWQADFFSATSPASASSALADSSSTSTRQRIKLPLVQQVWIEPEFAGVIELSRHFNWPHGDESAVFLQVDSDTKMDGLGQRPTSVPDARSGANLFVWSSETAKLAPPAS